MSGDRHQLVEAAPEEATAVAAPTSAVAVSVPAPTVATPLPAAHTALSLPTRSAAALTWLQELAGQLVPQLQYQVMRVGVAGQVGIAALAASAAVAIGALLPAYRTVQTLSTDLLRTQHPSAALTIEQAGSHLMASLPTRTQMPAVLGQVFGAAKAAGIALDSGHYTYSAAKSGVAQYNLEFPVKGASYPGIRAFINGTLTAVPAASLDKLHVERKAVGDQTVNADVGFVVFVRGDTP